MNPTLKVATFCLGATLAAGAFAQQPAVANAPAAAQAQPSAADKLTALIEGRHNGVTEIKRDANGAITSFVVVGRAPLNRTLPAAFAEQNAQRVAVVTAQRAVREFMQTKVEAKTTQTGNVDLYIKGQAGGDTGGASAQQTSESRFLTKDEIKSVTEGVVAGLQTIGEGVKRSGDMYVVVYGWSARTTAALSAVNALMQGTTDTPARNVGGQGAANGAANQGGPANAGQGNVRAVQPGVSISNDAAEFL